MIGVTAKVMEVRLNDSPAVKGDSFGTPWLYQPAFCTQGMRSFVGDVTIWTGKEHRRIKHAARIPFYTVMKAIESKNNQKKSYCDARGWDLWVQAFNAQGGADKTTADVFNGGFANKAEEEDGSSEWEARMEKINFMQELSVTLQRGNHHILIGNIDGGVQLRRPPPEIDESCISCFTSR